MGYRILPIVFFLISFVAQGQNSLYQKYIDKYKGYAIEQMKRYDIPASITLAQGLLESGAGTSDLARKGNNHFGIKVGGSWSGPYMLRNDDAPNEKFRVYRSAKASYEDHSKFLHDKPRYAQLFKLSPRDYKGWAHGLKKAGYATNPQYAYKLIDIIELYDLDQFDKGKHRWGHHKEKEDPFLKHPIHKCNKSYYVLALSADTYESLSKQLHISKRKLRKYNEVDKHHVLKSGDVVYLEKKQSKADKAFKGKFHVIRPGESMHSISQRYGMRIKTLYKINHKEVDYAPHVGDLLLIRK